MHNIKCNRCGRSMDTEDEMFFDMEACPREVWELYGGDIQDIELAWNDEWGYTCEECNSPRGPYDDLPQPKRAYMEAQSLHVGSFGLADSPCICPECGHQFRAGWSRLKAHWEAKHQDIEPFSDNLREKVTRYSYFDE